jgi:hypothetical protein
MNKTRYTPQMNEQIIRFYNLGYSYSEIAIKMEDYFNEEFTKNMICGRIDRMKKIGYKFDDKINALPSAVNV